MSFLAAHLTPSVMLDLARGLAQPADAAFASAHLVLCSPCAFEVDQFRTIFELTQADGVFDAPEAVVHRALSLAQPRQLLGSNGTLI